MTRIVGLTGGIAMGKSATVRILRQQGCAIYDADATVHRLLGPGGAAVAPVLRRFGAVGDSQGGIDRRQVGAQVFNDPAALAALEAILHPLVRRAQDQAMRAAQWQGRRVLILDVPLLVETRPRLRRGLAAVRAGGLHAVWTVSVPARVQARRALARPGMTADKLRGVLARQVPDRVRRRAATHVLRGMGGAQKLRAQVKRALRSLFR